jgi:hypothetical protein
MALLNDEQYAAGIKRIESALEGGDEAAPPVFNAKIAFMLCRGSVDA